MKPSTCALVACTILTLVTASAAAEPPAAAPAATPAQPAVGRQTLFACGDVMLARWTHRDYYAKGPAAMLGAVRHWSAEADVALANLECVIATRGRMWHKGEGRPFLYRGRPELTDILVEAGFDIVNTANNHSLDYGPEALLEQAELLDAVGIAQTGGGRDRTAAARPTYLRSGDLTLAFIGIEPLFPRYAATADQAGNFYAPEGPEFIAALRPVVEEARRHADLVIVTPHWGTNWTENTTSERRTLARQVIDLGVDAILGHSSHHLHGVEVYNGRPIVYDMGSFFFDKAGKKRLRYSAGFLLEFDRQGFHRLTLRPAYLGNNRTEPAAGEALSRIQELLTGLSHELDPQLVFAREGDALVLALTPPPRAPSTLTPAPGVVDTGRTRRLPDELRRRKTDVVVDTAPDYTRGFTPVTLDNGVEILGHEISEAVRPNRGFVAELALRVPGPLTGTWEATLVGRSSKKTFEWTHPIADGGWLPNLWSQGEIVLDRTFVRPPDDLPTGTYELFYRLDNLDEGTFAKATGGPAATDGLVPVGRIAVLDKGIPKGPAGVAWDGKLPDELRGAGGVARQVELRGHTGVIVAVAAGVLLLVALFVLGALKRRRRGTGAG